MNRARWVALLLLVAFGVSSALSRVLTLTGHANSLTKARLEAAFRLFPEYSGEFLEMEQHFARTGASTLVHVIAGGVFLALGILQFSPRIRARHPRFHRRSGGVLVAFAAIAGATGVWMGVVDPFSSTERLPTAIMGAVFLIAPVVAIGAIRRGEVASHREWMIRFYAAAMGIVVIRLVAPVILWLLEPASYRDTVGLTFWTGGIISQTVAEFWIRSTRANPAAYRMPNSLRAG